ncbi:hypothetical protein TGVEG_226660 [Toxoplasma gondii VEG]|uniref:Uncharacterized protein n=4 Tax=Toxoplasma gondii TaxID=5811 RepID=V4ZBH1_TOXGV|nr:hypothetical protein TGVEG_226660 [Toxoplasma gondii VEG]CEL76469.1 TPA: hypothetical protein BN1205_067710 [Toxoplasma gondii VEG]
MLQPHPRSTKAQNAAPGLAGSLSSGSLGLAGAAGLSSTSVPFLPPPSRHNGVSHAAAASQALAPSAASSTASLSSQAHSALRGVAAPAAAAGLPGSGAFLPAYASPLYAGQHAGPVAAAKGSRHLLHAHAVGAAGVGGPLTGSAPLQGAVGPSSASPVVHPVLELLQLQNAQVAESRRAVGRPALDPVPVVLGFHHLVHSPEEAAVEVGLVDVVEFPRSPVVLRHVLFLGLGERIHPNVDFEGQSDPAPADCELKVFARVLPPLSEYTATQQKSHANYRPLHANERLAAEAEARVGEGARPVQWRVFELESPETGSPEGEEDLAVDQLVVCGRYRALSVVFFGHVHSTSSKASFFADLSSRPGRAPASPSFVDLAPVSCESVASSCALFSSFSSSPTPTACPLLLGLHGLPERKAVGAGAALNALLQDSLLRPIQKHLEAWLRAAKTAQQLHEASREGATCAPGLQERRHAEKREEDGPHGDGAGVSDTPTPAALARDEQGAGALKRKRQVDREGLSGGENNLRGEKGDSESDARGDSRANNAREDDVDMDEKRPGEARVALDETTPRLGPRDGEVGGAPPSLDEEMEGAGLALQEGETKGDVRGVRETGPCHSVSASSVAPSSAGGAPLTDSKPDLMTAASTGLCKNDPDEAGVSSNLDSDSVSTSRDSRTRGGLLGVDGESGSPSLPAASLPVPVPSMRFWVESLQLVSRLFSGFVSSPDSPLASVFSASSSAAAPFSPDLLLLLAAASCGALEALVLGPKAREARRRAAEARALRRPERQGRARVGKRCGQTEGDNAIAAESSCAGEDAAEIAARLLGLHGLVRGAVAEARAAWEVGQTREKKATVEKGDGQRLSEDAVTPCDVEAEKCGEHGAPGEDAGRQDASPRRVFFDVEAENEMQERVAVGESRSLGSERRRSSPGPSSLFVSFLSPRGTEAGPEVGGTSLLVLVLRTMRRLSLLRETAQLLVAEGALELLMSILVEAPVLPTGEQGSQAAEFVKEARQEKIAARGWKVKVEALKALLVLASHVEGMERLLGWDSRENGEAVHLVASATSSRGMGASSEKDEQPTTGEIQSSLYSHFLQALASQISFSRYHLKRFAAVLLSRVKLYFLLASLQQVTVSLLSPSPSSAPSSSPSSLLASLSFAGPGGEACAEKSEADAYVFGRVCPKGGATRTARQILLEKGDAWVTLAAEAVEALKLQLLHQTLPASATAASRDERAETELAWPLSPSRPWSAAALVVASRPSLPVHLQRFLQARRTLASFAVLARCLHTRLGVVLCPSTADVRLLSSLRSVLLLFLRATNGPLFLASHAEATQTLLSLLEAIGRMLLSRSALLPDPLNSETHTLSLSLKQHLLALTSPQALAPSGLSSGGLPCLAFAPVGVSVFGLSAWTCMRALLAARRGSEALEAAAGPQDWVGLWGPAEQGFIEGLLPTKKEEEAAVMVVHASAAMRLHLEALALLERFLETSLLASESGEETGEIYVDVEVLAALERMAGTPGGRQAVAAAFRLRHADVFLAMLLVESVAALERLQGSDSELAPQGGGPSIFAGNGERKETGEADRLRLSGPSVERLSCLRSLLLLIWSLVLEDEFASFLLPCGPLLLVGIRPLALLGAQINSNKDGEETDRNPVTPGEEAREAGGETDEGRRDPDDSSFGGLSAQAQASSFIRVQTHCGVETLLRGDRELRSKVVSLYQALLSLYVGSEQMESLPSPSALLVSVASLPPPPSPRALVDSIRCLEAPCALRALQAAASAGPAGPGAPVGRLGSTAAPGAATAGPGTTGASPSGGAAGARAAPAAVFGGIEGGQGVELIDVAWGSELQAASSSPSLATMGSMKGQAGSLAPAGADAEAWELEGDTPPPGAPLSALLAARLLTLYVRRCPHVLLFAGPEEIEYFLSSDACEGGPSEPSFAGKEEVRDDGSQFLSKLAVEDDGDEEVAAWGCDRLDSDGLGPLERSLLVSLNRRGEAGGVLERADSPESEPSIFLEKQRLYARVGLANGVPTHPGLGLFLLSADGQKALISCLARCAARLEPPPGNLATMASWQLRGPCMHAWVKAREETLPLVRALLVLLYNVLHGLTRPVADDEEDDATGYRNLDLLQLLLLLTARLFAFGDWVGGAAWEAEARAAVAAACSEAEKNRGRKSEHAQNLLNLASDAASPERLCKHTADKNQETHLSSSRLFFSPSVPSLCSEAAKTSRWLAGAEAPGHGDSCLQARLCLAWCCRLFFLWFQSFRDSQAFLVKHLIRLGAASLPSLQQASLLLLTSLSSFSSILPAAPHSFHLLPSPRRPPVCGGGVSPLELASAAAEAKRDREKLADSRNGRNAPSCQLSATVAAMLPPTVTLSARVFSLLDMCSLDYRESREGVEAEEGDRGLRGKGPRPAPCTGNRIHKPEPETRPLYLCCEIDLTEEIAAAVSSSSSSLGPAAVFGRLSMGDEGIVPMEESVSAVRPEEEEEDVADVYRLLKETLWGGAEDEREPANEEDADKNELNSLRRWMRENENIRVEELAVLVSVVTRAAVSSSAALHALGSHAAAQLAAHRFPVYSLLFECMDTLLDTVLQNFADTRSEETREDASRQTGDEETEASKGDRTERPERENGALNEVFALVPGSRSLEASKCLCRLLLFIERLVALQAKASFSSLAELERLVSLPSTRLLQVSLTLISSPGLLVAAAGSSGRGARPAFGGEGGNLAERGADQVEGVEQMQESQKAVAQALLRCAIRLATNIVVAYQRLVNSAREAVERREACAFAESEEEKLVDVPNHLAVARKIAEALSTMCNRSDAAQLGFPTLGLALGFFVTLSAHPLTLLTATFDLPPHSSDAVLLPLRSGQAELTAVAAGANSALQLGAFFSRVAAHTRTAAQHPEDSRSHLWLGLADRLLLLVNLLLSHATHPVAPLFSLLRPEGEKANCPWESEPEVTDARDAGRGDEGADDLDIYADLQPGETEPEKGDETGDNTAPEGPASRAVAGLRTGAQKDDPRETLLRPLRSALETLLSQCQLFLAAQASRASHAKKLGEDTQTAADIEKTQRMRLLAQQAVALLAKTEETSRRIATLKLEPPPLLLEGSSFFPASPPQIPGLKECLFWGGEDAFLWDIVAHCDVSFNVSVRRANSLTDPLLPIPAAQPVRDRTLRLVLETALTARALESSEDWWAAVSLEAVSCEEPSLAGPGAPQAAGDATVVGAGSGALRGEAGVSGGPNEQDAKGRGAHDADAPQLPVWFSDPLARFHQAVSVPAPVDCTAGPPPGPPGRAPGYGASGQGAFASASAAAAGGARSVGAQGAGAGRTHEGSATADPFRSRTKSSSRAPSKHVDDYEAAVPGGLTFQKKPAAIPPPPPPEISAAPSRDVSPGDEGSAGQQTPALAVPAGTPQQATGAATAAPGGPLGPQGAAPPQGPLHTGAGPFSGKETEKEVEREQADGPQVPVSGAGSLRRQQLPFGVEVDPSTSQAMYSGAQAPQPQPQGPGQQQAPLPFQQLPPATAFGLSAARSAPPGAVGPGGSAGSGGALPGRAPAGDSLGPMFVPGGAAGPQAPYAGFQASQIPASTLHVAPGYLPAQPAVAPLGAPGTGLGETPGLSVHPGMAVQPQDTQIPSSRVGHHGLLPPHLGDPGAFGPPGQPARGVGPGDPRPEEPGRCREGRAPTLAGPPVSDAPRDTGGAEEQGLDAVPGWKEFAADGLRENMDVSKLAQHPELLKDPRIKSRFMRLLSRHEQIKNIFRMLGLDV